MTAGEQPKEYIITKEMLIKLKDAPLQEQADEIAEIIRQRPYNEQAIREQVLDDVFAWVDSHPYSIRKDGYEYYRVSREAFADKIAELRSRGGGEQCVNGNK